jgi:hypothetical protein
MFKSVDLLNPTEQRNGSLLHECTIDILFLKAIQNNHCIVKFASFTRFKLHTFSTILSIIYQFGAMTLDAQFGAMIRICSILCKNVPVKPSLSK